MSGHSDLKKEKTDNARGKIFTKIGREIAIAVKEGGGDPANNSKLRDVIAKAKAANMPNDNINRSIKKAVGEAPASTTRRALTRATVPPASRSSSRSLPTTRTAPPRSCATYSTSTATAWATPAAFRTCSTRRALSS